MQNEQTRVCQYCQSEIARNKKVCPVCHRKESHPVKVALLCFLGFCTAIILLFDLAAFVAIFTPQSDKPVRNNPGTDRYHHEQHIDVDTARMPESLTFSEGEVRL